MVLEPLASLIRRWAPSTGIHPTPLSGLTLLYATDPSEPLASVYKPSICVVAQGAKTATLGDQTYRYDPGHYLVTTVHLPLVGRIVEASPERPFLSLKLSFDADLVLSVLASVPRRDRTEVSRGVGVSSTTAPLVDALVRLLGLFDKPDDLAALGARRTCGRRIS